MAMTARFFADFSAWLSSTAAARRVWLNAPTELALA